MNMKDTVILLIFLLAVVGLIIGVYYTESDSVDKSSENSEIINEDSNGVITITFEKENNEYFEKFLT